MLDRDTIYYIRSIKVGGKEISEENPVFIKCETWQWGVVKKSGHQNIIDTNFSQWALPNNISINSNIYVFNRSGGFGEMVDHKNDNPVEIGLVALTESVSTISPRTRAITSFPSTGLPITTNVLDSDVDNKLFTYTFQDIIENKFMIVDHFAFASNYAENRDGYLSAKNSWSGLSSDMNIKLWNSLSLDEIEESKPKGFRCFGQSPIAFPPQYEDMDLMAEEILAGKFEGRSIFRWFGRTEGEIIRINTLEAALSKDIILPVKHGDTLNYYVENIQFVKNTKGVANFGVFNDYEKTIIYNGNNKIELENSKRLVEENSNHLSPDNHVDLKFDSVAINSIELGDGVYGSSEEAKFFHTLIINNQEFHLPGSNLTVSLNNDVYEQYLSASDPHLVFLKEESQFIFSNDIDDLFGSFEMPKKLTEDEVTLLSKIKAAIENKDLVIIDENLEDGYVKELIAFSNIYCLVEEGDRTISSEEGCRTTSYNISVGRNFEHSASDKEHGYPPDLKNLIGKLKFDVQDNKITIPKYRYDDLCYVEPGLFLEALNVVAKQDFKIASVAWYDDCQRVLYARKNGDKFDYIILDRDEWEETEYFKELLQSNGLDLESDDDYDQISELEDQVYDDLCSDAALMAPKWFY